MRHSVKRRILAFYNDDRGVTLVEYALALTVAIIVGTGGVVLLGDGVGAAMTRAVVSMPD